MSKFTKDLKNGKKLETLISTLLESMGWTCVPSGEKAGWDLQISKNGVTYKIEMKFDLMATKTGNIAIEYWNPKKNKPSGLTISSADYWVYGFEEDSNITAFITKLSALKKYLDNYSPKRIISVGGDDNASLLLYDKMTLLSAIFTPVDHNFNNSYFE